MEPGLKLSKSMAPTIPDEIAQMKSVPYASAVRSLMYLVVATRPDIVYTVRVLCRFTQDLGITHWKAVKHFFRYLKGTQDYNLTFSPTTSCKPFQAYSDADHAGNVDNRKSTSGYLIKIGSVAISWSSKLQPVVALSTMEAEYIAAVHAGKEVIWFQQFLTELGVTLNSPSTLQIDNQSAIAISKNPEHHRRMKHLDLCFFWLRDEVEKGAITPTIIPTTEMAADLLTNHLIV